MAAIGVHRGDPNPLARIGLRPADASADLPADASVAPEAPAADAAPGAGTNPIVEPGSATGPLVMDEQSQDPRAASPKPVVVEVLNMPARPGDPPGSEYVKLQDGRVYRRSPNPQDPRVTDFVHAARGMDPQGNRIQVGIIYAQFPDGAFQRLVQQQVESPNGDRTLDTIVGGWDKDDKQVAEQSRSIEKITLPDGTKRDGTETTVSTFENGQRIKRETDILNKEYAEVADLAAPGPEKITAETKIHGVWENGGQPIVDAPGPGQTIPVIDRSQHVQRVTPGAGLHKDRDRILTYEQHAAGPVNQLRHDPMKLIVRFEGNKDAIWKQDQYIERELRVPVNAQGQPQMNQAEEVRTTDNQAPHVKAMMQARIWGGFASNLAIIAGANFRGLLGGAAQPLIYAGFGAAAAETVGEGHALATNRADGSWPRMAMSLYDTTWTGLYTLYTRGRFGGMSGLDGTQSRAGIAALGLGGTSAAGQLALNSAFPVGAPGTGSFADTVSSTLGLNNHARGSVSEDWRPVEKFDAAGALQAAI